LIEDDSQISELLERYLRRKGHDVVSCGDGEAGLAAYKEKCFPVVICDIVMPRMTGIDFLHAIAGLPRRADSSVLLMTAHANVESAIAALKLGAYDYFTKPINLFELTAVLERITATKQLTDELAKHREHLETLVTERTRELGKTVHELQVAGATLTEQARLLDIAHDYIMVHDLDNKVVYWNQGAEKGYGFSADEARGQVAHKLLKTQFPIPQEEIMSSIFKKGHWEGELVNTRKDGKQVVIHSNQTLNRDAMGNPVSILGIHHDITDQKNLDTEMRRFDKLNTIGEMAASIGHEVRNPLTTVRGYLQLFQRKEEVGEYREQIQTMIDELDRANAIISEFLSLAKDKRIALKPTYLNSAIRKILPLLQAAAVREDKELAVELAEVPKLIVDEDEITQCILNLARNALDAVPPGGTVNLSTYGDGQNKVCFAVRDNGSGIPPEISARLGTPFVTSKDNGTGLGLPVCYRIAERNKAKLEFETGARGTTFILKFDLLA